MLSFAQHLTVSWRAIRLDVLEFIGFIVLSTTLRVTFKQALKSFLTTFGK